ncbi:MAG: MFS transporter [Desulfatiglans sp.]|jgi:FSR family fosmidomycin resistance protein-like MFS transporter|nr:MFS transporter [Desulfatiglans sp.]
MSDNKVDIISGETEKSVDTPKMHTFSILSLIYFIIAHMAHHLLTALPQPMLPYMQQEFKLNYTKAATITSAFSISGGLSQLPAGWLADRIGPTFLITMGIVGVAIGGLFVGLSMNYWMVIGALVFMGLMSGGYHPASTPLIAMSVPPHLKGRAIGLHLVGGNSSFLFAPLIAAEVAGMWGWRGAYLTLAVPTAVLGTMFFFYLNKRYGKAHIEAMKKKQTEEKPPQPGYKRRLWAFLIMMVLGGGAGATVHSFLSLYTANELGATNEQAARVLAWVFMHGIYGGFIGGFISDKIGSAKVIIATDILGGLLIFGLVGVQEYNVAYIAVLISLGLVHAIRFPVAEVFIMGQSPAKHRSMIYGIYYSTMQYTGAIFAPIMGHFIDIYGFHTMFTFSAYAVTAVAFITAFFIYDAKD